ncbi:hypothetical protein BGZ79_007346 [Entomortierella chlamydospora]|nr:hypothetical protein BGZ79_007346 [Entomortierella chlamydospora]
MTFAFMRGSRARQQSRAISSSPLHIPEILSMIFSYLNQYTLSNSVRLVCKQWYSSAFPLIRVNAVLNTSESARHRLEALLARLHLVTDFRISSGRSYNYETAKWLLESLSTKVDSLKTSNQLHISKIEFREPTDHAQLVYPLLSKITTLTVIDMAKISDDVDLGAILAACPALRRFRVVNQSCEDYQIIVGTQTFTESGIESLIIKGMHVEQTGFESILERCPRLQVLKLDHIRHMGAEPQLRSFDRPRFFAAASASCPELNQFHLSVHGESPTPEHASSMIQAFFPGSLSKASTSSKLASRDQFDQYKPRSLDTVSVLDKDIRPDTCHILLSPFLDSYYNGTITTLEIMPAVDIPNYDCVVHALHNLLCSTPSLLHLIAPSVPYFAEYFDPSELAVADKSHPLWNCKLGCPATQANFSEKRIWACRGLKTLQVRIISRFSDDEPTPKNSRMMFGYISRVCPNLQELAVYREELNLNLEGGLCFLSRLTELRKLVVVTRTKTMLKKKDLNWMARHPKRNTTLFSRWRKTPLATSSKDIIAKDSKTQRKLTLDDLKEVALAKYLATCREELAQGRGGEGCWPMLEYLGIRHADGNNNDPVDYLPALVSKIRPRVEFSCNYNDLTT